MEATTERQGIDLHSFLGFQPNSKRLATCYQRLLDDAAIATPPEPEVKAFSDCVYYAYHLLGICLLCQPIGAYKIKSLCPRKELDETKLRLASLDIYNHQAALEPPSNKPSKSERSSSKKPSYAPFPSYPIRISYPSVEPPFEPKSLLVTPETLGKDFVNALGEPDRKGGGEGSIGIWTEWTGVGVMVEFASGGLQAWDKGGDAVWRVITIFERGVQAGKEDGE